MAHKRQTKGRNKRRSASKNHYSVKVRQDQARFESLVVEVKKASNSLINATAILVLSPTIFNVKKLADDGQIDLTKLRAKDMIAHGRTIIDNHERLTLNAKALETDVEALVKRIGGIQIAQTNAADMVAHMQDMLEVHARCEEWLIDFNNHIHSPIVEAMVILNEAVTGKPVDITDIVELTRGLKSLAEEKETGND